MKISSSIRLLVFFLVFMASFVFWQDNSIANAQACTLPAQVSNLNIDFPNCTGDVCDFTQGQCTWTGVGDATSYQVNVTVVETGATVTSQQVSETNLTFSVTESNTYKCDVSAINSCGTGPTASASLLCKVDAAVDISPTPVAPVEQTQPTAPEVVNGQPVPVTGNSLTTVYYGIIGVFVLLAGIVIMALL